MPHVFRPMAAMRRSWRSRSDECLKPTRTRHQNLETFEQVLTKIPRILTLSCIKMARGLCSACRSVHRQHEPYTMGSDESVTVGYCFTYSRHLFLSLSAASFVLKYELFSHRSHPHVAVDGGAPLPSVVPPLFTRVPELHNTVFVSHSC